MIIEYEGEQVTIFVEKEPTHSLTSAPKIHNIVHHINLINYGKIRYDAPNNEWLKVG